MRFPLVPALLLSALPCAQVARASVIDVLVQEILDALKNVVTCGGCHGVLLPAVKLLANLGDDAFDGAFTEICKIAKACIADDDVCEGEFSLTGPLIAHSLRAMDIGGLTATKFCSAIFGLCQPPDVTPYTVPFPKPASTTQTQVVSRGRTPFQVVHFSDVHVDRNYTVGAEVNCTKPLCCRNFADETGPVTEPAGPFGGNKCGAPVELSQSMLDAIGDIAPGAAFSIFTGDVVSHDSWLVDQAEATDDMVNWNSMMANGLSAPVFPTLGNHDSAPVNSFPRNTTTGENVQWVFDLNAAGWGSWINTEGVNQVMHRSGSFALVAPGTNLRRAQILVISLNTMYWYKQNFWIYDNNNQIADPNGVLAFMVEQLQAAEDASQRAWVIGHIPPGKTDVPHDQVSSGLRVRAFPWLDVELTGYVQSNYYDQVVQRYKNTIAGQFYGHTHQDQFEIAYSNYSQQSAETADSFVWIAPSLVPTSGHPAFKVYDVDPDTYEVMDAKVYIANMSDPQFQIQPVWTLYYSARASYGPLAGALSPTDALNASFWHKVTEAFETDDGAFQLYNARQKRGVNVDACVDDANGCRTNIICDLRAARSENNCDLLKIGVNLKREEGGSAGWTGEEDLCETGMSKIMRRMAALRYQ
ncbi:sphingomyelin phosphodiesterase [Amylostereum chailletii]|nr:sphingomyelin phosphodiesterase [Amylostereum chailletii]